MIRKVKYPKWLTDVLVVKKKNGNDQVCVDYMNLNKTHPKDPFTLPYINVW